MKYSFLIALISVSLLMLNTRLSFGQQADPSTPPQNSPALSRHAEKIRSKVQKLGVGQDVTVVTTRRDYHGTINKTAADSFQVADVDLNQVITINYSETKSIYNGYSDKNIWGRRANPRTSRVVFVVAVAALIGLGIFAASQTR